MKNFRIISSAWVDMGTYQANSREEALDMMAQDAGYKNAAEAAEVAGPFNGTVKEVEGS